MRVFKASVIFLSFLLLWGTARAEEERILSFVSDIEIYEDSSLIVTETIEVVAVGVKLKVPAGKFTQAVRLRETTTKDEPTTHSWVVPGLGEVRERGKGGKNQLIARSLQESAAAPLDD